MNEAARLDLTEREESRYARHLVLPSIGREGQLRLKAARVLLVGAGGLGSAISLYLAGVGVGHLTIVDDDTVGLSNLQRQILHGTATLGHPKTASAQQRLNDLNPDIEIRPIEERFTSQNARTLARGYDLIVDGTDNFDTRYLINDTCLSIGIPYVYGAIFRLSGQLSVLCTPEGPCYRCLFPEAPPKHSVLSGERAGILGAIPGVIGTLQATEVIKWIVGFGQPLRNRLLVFHGGDLRFDEIHVLKNPDCPACGKTPAQSLT